MFTFRARKVDDDEDAIACQKVRKSESEYQSGWSNAITSLLSLSNKKKTTSNIVKIAL
jgi:hypothetical protein